MTKTTNVRANDLNYDKYANEIYDDDIRRSIPGHDNLHKEIIKTVREYTENHEVMKILGIEQGPKVGMVLSALLEEVLENHSKNEPEYLELDDDGEDLAQPGHGSHYSARNL